uniref:Protein phosphatase CheZ n=1 Tax=Desulfacinum infernum TaxID=35837 RepID=A0A832EIY0_9BACT
MDMIGKDEWRDLLQLVDDVERTIAETGADSEPAWNRCADALKTLSSTAAMLGMDGLAKAGGALEVHLEQKVRGNGSVSGEARSVFQFAVNALREHLSRASRSESARDIDPHEVLSIVEDPNEGTDPDEPQVSGDHAFAADGADEDAVIDRLVGVPARTAAPSREVEEDKGISSVEEFCRRVQGAVCRFGDGDRYPVAHIEVPLTPEALERLRMLLNPTERLENLRMKVSDESRVTETVLEAIKDFMQALSDGDLSRAEKILGDLAESRHPGLYREIGGIARELHNSLRDFVRTMDPSLREMVEEKIPDSGNRLEHIIKLTETAANTTLDHVEALQKRNEKDQERLEAIGEVLTGLHPLGESAQKKLDEAVAAVRELLGSAQKSHEDLIRILTAQDYQDLTGQIILKIMALLEDLETKLVQLIAKFGVKVDKARKTKEELYGPAHEAVEDALHSQSDVDALLAEFGF